MRLAKSVKEILFFQRLSIIKNQPIGMGRVIGDGAYFCQVVDICLLPKYQGQGFGKVIMIEIKAYLFPTAVTSFLLQMRKPSSCTRNLVSSKPNQHPGECIT